MEHDSTNPASAVELVGHASSADLLSVARIKLRLMVLTSLIVLLLTGLLFFLVDSVFRSIVPTIEQDLRWKAKSTALEASQSGDLGVLTRDAALLSSVTTRYAEDADVLYLGFEDAKSTVLFERGSLARAPRWSEANAVAENDDAYAIWAPIEVEGMRVGLARAVVSKERLRSGTELYRRILWAGVGGAAVALLLALLFVSLYVVPILQFAQRAFSELERTTALALASTRAKSQFLANMSHEIRTPMNGVLGMVHLVQQTPLSHTQRGYVDVIAASARSLLKIVNDILDFSKLEAQRYELDPRPVDLAKLVQQTVALFEARAREKQLSLVATYGSDLPRSGVVDGDRLRQVLSNLLSNAIKFTNEGSVKVEVVPAQGAPAAGPEPGDAAAPFWLRVGVLDTGPGVPKEAEKRLFRAFSQVDASSTRHHEGTGLGLAISKRLVELMGGNIGYAAPPTGGSEFYFEVPVLSCADPATSTQAPRRITRFSSPHPVLVVDDNEVNQLVAMEILEKLGLEVSLVGGGQEAADAVAADQYSLVLMDCQMPGVDGYMATRLIREREANGRRLPIVACTAHALEDERKKVEAAGMDGYLSKPIEFEALTAVLSRWLDSASVESSPIEPGANDLPSESDRDTSKILSAQPDERTATSNGLLPVLDPERAPSARVAAIFMKNVPNELTRLRNSAASNDREVVKAVAHKLKGSAGSIGATLLSAECDRLQIDAATMSNAEMNATVTAVERFYEQVRSELVARTPGELH